MKKNVKKKYRKLNRKKKIDPYTQLKLCAAYVIVYIIVFTSVVLLNNIFLKFF